MLTCFARWWLHDFSEFLNASPLARAVFGGRTDCSQLCCLIQKTISYLGSSSAVDPPLDYLLNQGAASAAWRRRLLEPSWSVLRQTIRLINLTTIFRTLKKLRSLIGYPKVKHVRMLAKDARTARTLIRILFPKLKLRLSLSAQILLSCCAMFLCTNTTQAHSIIKYTCLRQGLSLSVFGDFFGGNLIPVENHMLGVAYQGTL